MKVFIRDSVEADGIQFRANEGSVLIVVEYDLTDSGSYLLWVSRARAFVSSALSGSFEIKERQQRLGIGTYIAEVSGDVNKIQELLKTEARNINERIL